MTQDIRFGSFSQNPPASTGSNGAGAPHHGEQKKSGLRISRKIIFSALIVVILAILGLFGQKYILGSKDVSSDSYSAIFLTNGQVYFGKIMEKGREEVALVEVFYLQTDASGEVSPNEPRFTLVKLGQELHGPTNKMYINREHILFHEDLREDSEIVSSIKNFK